MAGVVGCRGSLEERLRSRYQVDDVTSCWNWTGAISAGKYGSLYSNGRMQKAHRLSYELSCGSIPDGLDLDHLCRNTRCINPAHLEPVTRSENLRRSPIMDRHSHKTRCPNGHPYEGENLHVRTNGHRVCVTCRRAKNVYWNGIRREQGERARNSRAV